MSNKKAPVASWGGTGRAGGALKSNGQVQYTTDIPHLSSLIDLAQFTFEKQFERAAHFQQLADQHRRRAFRAYDALREYQRLLSEGQQ